jgi:hypothetical protein
MPDKSAPATRPLIHPVATPIGGWWRTGIAILGLAGLGAGGVAVFVTSLEAGPVALLVVGLIFFLVAAGGRLPSRLKVGDNEAAWEGVDQFVRDVAENVPTQQTPELVNALADLAEVAPTAAAAGLSTVSSRTSYGHLVTSMLLRAVTKINQEASMQGGSPGAVTPLTVRVETSGGLTQTRSDAEIRDVSGNLLIIEIKYLTHRLPTDLIMQLRKQVGRYAAETQATGSKTRVEAFLISNQEYTGTVLGLEVMPDRDVVYAFQCIRVTGEDDLPKLVNAIRTAFGCATV